MSISYFWHILNVCVYVWMWWSYHIPSNSQFSLKLLLNQPVSNLVCHIEPHWQKKYISFSKSKRNGNLRKMVVTISHQEERVRLSRAISHLLCFTMAPMPIQYYSCILPRKSSHCWKYALFFTQEAKINLVFKLLVKDFGLLTLSLLVKRPWERPCIFWVSPPGKWKKTSWFCVHQFFIAPEFLTWYVRLGHICNDPFPTLTKLQCLRAFTFNTLEILPDNCQGLRFLSSRGLLGSA